MSSENTLEVYRLIVGADEIEFEADDSISGYLIERAAKYGNKLGLQRKKVKEFEIVQDGLSDGWVLIFMCERYF